MLVKRACSSLNKHIDEPHANAVFYDEPNSSAAEDGVLRARTLSITCSPSDYDKR